MERRITTGRRDAGIAVVAIAASAAVLSSPRVARAQSADGGVADAASPLASNGAADAGAPASPDASAPSPGITTPSETSTSADAGAPATSAPPTGPATSAPADAGAAPAAAGTPVPESTTTPPARRGRAAPAARASGPEESREEPGVTVIGSSSRALERIPGSASVVSERDMARIQPLTVNEALRRVPGVYVRDEEGMGLRPNISVRGLDPTRSSRVLVLEDGIPVSLAPYSEPEMYYNPPVDRMARIEVVRGSGNILFGPQTIGGVINYITPPVPARRTVNLRATAGDRGLLTFHAMYGDRIGNAGFILSALRRQGEGFRGIRFEVTDLYGKFLLRMGPSSDLLVRLGFYDEGSASTYLGLTQPMFEADPNQNPAQYDWFRLRRYSASVVHTWTIVPRVQLRTAVYGYMTDRDWTRQRYDRVPIPGLLYARIAGDQSIPGGAIFLRDASLSNNRSYQVFGVEPKLQARFQIGPFRNELDAGVRFLYERALLSVLLGGPVYDNGMYVLGSGQSTRGGENSSEEQRDGWALAAYVQDRFFLTDRLQITPGLRLENYNYSRLTRRELGMDVYHRGTGSVVQLIPGASVSYGSQTLTVFGGFHLGYAPPRIAAAITPRGIDVQLNPELSYNSEVGARLNLGSWLRSELSLFWIEFVNEIIRVSGQESEFTNGGPSRYLGVEAMGSADFGRLARIPTSVYLQARYTGIHSQFVGGMYDGNQVPYAVPHTLVLTAGAEHPFPMFTVGGQASWSFASQHFTDRDNSRVGSVDGLYGPIPAYNTLDLAARVTHRPTGLAALITIKNVQGYATDAQGRPLVYIASRSPEGIFPGGFGQVMVTLRWDHSF